MTIYHVFNDKGYSEEFIIGRQRYWVALSS